MCSRRLCLGLSIFGLAILFLGLTGLFIHNDECSEFNVCEGENVCISNPPNCYSYNSTSIVHDKFRNCPLFTKNQILITDNNQEKYVCVEHTCELISGCYKLYKRHGYDYVESLGFTTGKTEDHDEKKKMLTGIQVFIIVGNVIILFSLLSSFCCFSNKNRVHPI